MSEARQVAILVAVQLAIAVIVILIVQAVMYNPGDAYAEYHAVVKPGGILVENITYHVKPDRKYHYLFRVWDARLTMEGEGYPEPYIELINVTCPPGSIPYARFGTRLKVFKWMPPSIFAKLSEEVNENEVGCYFPDGIPSGSYTVVYVFRLVPPIHFDGSLWHVNIKFAERHIYYDKVVIRFDDIDPVVVYTHPPILKARVVNNSIVVEGFAVKNMLVEVEVVYQRGPYFPDHFVERVADVQATVEARNTPYLTLYRILQWGDIVTKIAMFLWPIGLLAFYVVFGREVEKAVVPKYLSYVPNPKRKPWEVNLLFKGDAIEIDDDALYATILDLVRRGVVKLVKGDEDDVVLELPKEDPPGLDEYEKRVLNTLRELALGNKLSFKALREYVESLAKQKPSEAYKIYRKLLELTRTPPELAEYAKRFVKPRRFPIWLAITLGVLGVFAIIFGFATQSETSLLPYLPTTLIQLGGFCIIAATTAALPSQVLGRWKPGFYREKLMWDAFRNMLSDLAAIRKYAPRDITIWKEWLVYATALGVAEKVIEAMKQLNIPVPREAYIPLTVRTHYMAISTAALKTSGGGTGGGGFGAGGGFGGGGAGVR